MKEEHRVELLSPAGNAKGFYGAIHAGADAVYLAGNRFGARAYAENFATEELVACIRYAHLMGRKIYLTVNTLLKEYEIAELYDYILPFYEAGLDAVIVQDLGVFRFLRNNFPELALHVSTQMTLCGSYGAALLRDMGASRVVPARELKLEELAAIKRTGIEVEAFIHGAMCYSYSGQCLFSSILGGRSGNRGRCAQPCRLPYSADTGDTKCVNCYPLSLKDMCTIDFLPQLIEAGIDSFKIEGRMKKPEYTAGVTAVYRKYIDRYYELRERMGREEAAGAYLVKGEDSKILGSLYIRSEVQDGYYFKHSGREMVTLENSAYSASDEKLLAGIQEKYVRTPAKLPVSVTAVFRKGQPAEVTLRWQALSATVRGLPVEQAQRQPIRVDNVKNQLGKLGDSAFFASDVEVVLEENCFYPLKQLNELRRSAVSELERQILFSFSCGKRNAGKAEIKKAEQIEEKDRGQGAETKGYAISVCTEGQLRAVADYFLAEAAGTINHVCPLLRVYIDSDLLLSDWEKTVSLMKGLPDSVAVYAALPYIIRESDRQYLGKLSAGIETLRKEESVHFRGILARSMDGLGFLREQKLAQEQNFMREQNTAWNQKTVQQQSTVQEQKSGLSCRADAGVYVWNRDALRELKPYVDGFCLPRELRASEQRGLTGDFPCEKIVYGRIPMMITANCLVQTVDKCRKRQEAQRQQRRQDHRQKQKRQKNAVSNNCDYVILTDRLQREFPVAVNCAHCMNVIYNCVPFSLHRELAKWKNAMDLRMDFTLESGEDVKLLLDSFLGGLPFPFKEYTTGHEKRGVE